MSYPLCVTAAQEYLTKIQDEEDDLDDSRGVTGGSEDDADDADADDAEDPEDGSLRAAARAQRLTERLHQDAAQVSIILFAFCGVLPCCCLCIRVLFVFIK